MELAVKGRLDSYWADHLSVRLSEVVQRGRHHLRLNLAETNYLSSAGIGVVMQYYKQLRAIDGSLVVVDPSKHVARILSISGLTQLLSASGSPGPRTKSAADEARSFESQGARYEVYEESRQGSLAGRTIGDPSRLDGCRLEEGDSRTIPFSDAGFALGLGAIASGFDDSRERFGEFLSVAGAGAYLPTDGTNSADYLVSAGGSTPDMCVLYGLECQGDFSHLARFESLDGGEAVTLSSLAEESLSIVEADAAGAVIVAESNGLVGAALRRSPAMTEDSGAPFSFPGIRDWLSFTPERSHANATVLLVGIVQRGLDGPFDSVVRPLEESRDLFGHFHAAVFTYGPLQRGRIPLRPAVTKLFRTERLQTVLHLLNDKRPIAGAGESEFTRGACWISPLRAAETNGIAR